MVNWTKEQHRAIEKRDINLLVSAAAGSGKTAVLVERIIQSIIKDKVTIDRLLVVTFTNAAAAGMKEKIHKEIISEMSANKNEVEFLKKQLNSLSRSHISTMHSFCFDVIRKYFYLINIDPDFKVMDSNDSNLLLEEVINNVLSIKYEEINESFFLFADTFSENRGDNKLVELIKKIYKNIQSYAKPLDWLEKSVESLLIDNINIEETVWMKILKNEAIKYFDFVQDEISKAIDLCPENMPYYSTLLDDKYIVDCLKIKLDTNFEEFIDGMQHIDYKRLNPLTGKNKELFNQELAEEIKYYRNSYKKALEDIIGFLPAKTYETLIDELEYMYPIMKNLFQIVKTVDEEFTKRKRDKKSLDFNDAEHLTLEILDFSEASSYYREKFNYIYIDEYQDTNEVQEAIISKVKKDNNLFMVGDVKQSIYRFRKADPTIFIDKYHRFQNNNKNELILLNKNFRSRNEILCFINDMFSELMTEELGEINYDEDAFLNVGTEFEERENSIEINIIEKKPDEEIEDYLMELKKDEIEAQFIANKIKKLVTEKKYNSKEKKWENTEYKDIVILLRSAASWANTFEKTFYEEGIPFYSDISNNYFETIEIKIMINLLKLIDNTRQDIPLLSVLRSPIGGFTIDEMIKLKITSKNREYYKSLKAFNDNNEKDLKNKIDAFFDKIYKWRWESRNSKLSTLVWKILIETEYYYFNGILPNGNIKQGNLRLLVDRADDYERDGYSGISDFIEYLERLKKSSNDLSSAKMLGENDNVVRLMTIHKSKGLEFPIVICAGLSKKFNQSDLKEEIILNQKCMAAPKYININKRIFKETLPRYASKIQIKKENISEEMRVLYVAFTRAIDRLILVGTTDNFEKWKARNLNKDINYYNLATKNNYLDWLGIILLSCVHKYPIKNVKISEISENESHKIITANNSIDDLSKFKIVDMDGYETINKKFAWKYVKSEDYKLPGKITVTDIKELLSKNKENIKYKIPNLKEVPMFKSKGIGFTPAEIGTITHSVLQLIKIKQKMSKEYIEKSISEMVVKKQLTVEESSVIQIDKIFNFYNSDLGDRMLKSSKVVREQPFIIKKKISEIIDDESINKEDYVLVQGIIDCYFHEADGLVLIDYKTDNVTDNNIDILVKYYSPQIIAYKEALEKLTKLKVKESHLFLLGPSINKIIE